MHLTTNNCASCHLKILLVDILEEIHVRENWDLCHTGRRMQKMREMKMEGGGWGGGEGELTGSCS
jgi:hypothetical protein